MAFIGLVLLLFAFTIRRMTGDIAHPATVFPAVWGVILVLIQSAQPLGYYGVGAPALLLFLAGSLAFSFGALAGSGFTHRIKVTNAGQGLALDFRKLAAFALLLHACLIPLWWQEVQELTNGADNLLSFAFQLRIKSVYDELTVGALVGNYLVVGFIFVPVFALGVMQGRVGLPITLLVSLPWIVTNLLTNGRSSLVQLVLAVIYLRVLQPKPMPIRVLAGMIGLFCVIFGAGAVLVGKGGIDADSSSAESLKLIVMNFFDYALQGPILFSSYLDNPGSINPSWDPFRTFCQALQKAGMCEPGPLHQDFLYFGRGPDQIGNVYSIFLSTFPKYGVLGTLLILGICGLWTGYHHQRWRQGSSLFHAIVASFLFAAIVLSIFLDSFFPLANFLLKVALVSMLLPLFFGARQTPAAPVEQS